jgi:hypothetical protein
MQRAREEKALMMHTLTYFANCVHLYCTIFMSCLSLEIKLMLFIYARHTQCCSVFFFSRVFMVR